jgi:hypothetical protein
MPAPTVVRTALGIVLLVFLATGALYGMQHGLPAALADAQTLKARKQIERWRNGRAVVPTLAEWGRVRSRMVSALATAPDNAQLLDDLGFLYAYRAQNLPPDPDLDELRKSLLVEAAAYFHSSAVLRPMFPYGWAQYALALHYLDETEASLWPPFDRALAYGRNEAPIQMMLARIAFARWSSLGPDREQAILAMLADAPAQLQRPLLELAGQHAITLNLPPRP